MPPSTYVLGFLMRCCAADASLLHRRCISQSFVTVAYRRGLHFLACFEAGICRSHQFSHAGELRYGL